MPQYRWFIEAPSRIGPVADPERDYRDTLRSFDTETLRDAVEGRGGKSLGLERHDYEAEWPLYAYVRQGVLDNWFRINDSRGWVVPSRFNSEFLEVKAALDLKALKLKSQQARVMIEGAIKKIDLAAAYEGRDTVQAEAIADAREKLAGLLHSPPTKTYRIKETALARVTITRTVKAYDLETAKVKFDDGGWDSITEEVGEVIETYETDISPVEG